MNYYKLKRLSDNKYFYRNEYFTVKILKKQLFWIQKPFYTSNIKLSKNFESFTKCKQTINECVKYEKYKHHIRGNKKYKHHIRGNKIEKRTIEELEKNYLIEQFGLIKKDISEYIKLANRGEFVFKIQNNYTKKFIKNISVGQNYSNIELSKFYGKIFLQYSVAKNFKKNMIKNYNGWRYVTTKKIKKRLENLYDIVCYSLENVYKKELLIEKKINRKN